MKTFIDHIKEHNGHLQQGCLAVCRWTSANGAQRECAGLLIAYSPNVSIILVCKSNHPEAQPGSLSHFLTENLTRISATLKIKD